MYVYTYYKPQPFHGLHDIDTGGMEKLAEVGVIRDSRSFRPTNPTTPHPQPQVETYIVVVLPSLLWISGSTLIYI